MVGVGESDAPNRAEEAVEKAKNILIELFPSIKSLDTDMREDLEGELMDLD